MNIIILRIKLKITEESTLGTVDPYALDEAALGANGSEEAGVPVPKIPVKSEPNPFTKAYTNPNRVKTTA